MASELRAAETMTPSCSAFRLPADLGGCLLAQAGAGVGRGAPVRHAEPDHRLPRG
ncbi:hypothetical protein QJS66_21825 [Kocuria rhizophila]|nr:hypothetical protein QJS66_21825 [Kocuria rhizophila]